MLLTTGVADSRPHFERPRHRSHRSAQKRGRRTRALCAADCLEAVHYARQSYLSDARTEYNYRPAQTLQPSSITTKLSAIRRELETVRRAQSVSLAEACSVDSPNSTLFPSTRWLQGLFTRGFRLRTKTVAPPLAPEGSGEEIVLQGFNWESWRAGQGSGSWWSRLASRVDEIRHRGFSTVWLPPPTQSVSPQGYMPCDLYDLNASYYGSEAQLRALVAELRARKIKPVADVVLNHRCASRQGPEGVYNLFGGRLDWDATAIVSDDDRFAGRGSTAKKDLGHAFFEAAPNIDHGNARVKRDMTNWINWLRHDVGFEGWRLDFVRGFCGSHVHDYVNASNARFVVGEFWDGLQYSGDGRPSKCQDAHRERIVRWINAAGGQACAFDITTKGILHAVLDGSGEYWRLRDVHGRAPGLIGLWPSRAVTFVENHDTGSTQGHWRFPSSRVAQGYAYILTHPGTPCVFYDHAFLWEDLREAISSLIAIRKRAKIHCRSVLRILAAEQGLYAAEVDSRLTVKLGPKSWQPEAGWTLSAWGDQWAVWERTNFNL